MSQENPTQLTTKQLFIQYVLSQQYSFEHSMAQEATEDLERMFKRRKVVGKGKTGPLVLIGNCVFEVTPDRMTLVQDEAVINGF